LIKRHIPDRGKILNHGKPILMNPINNRNKEYNTTAIKDPEILGNQSNDVTYCYYMRVGILIEC
jgi:hypothetical protein